MTGLDWQRIRDTVSLSYVIGQHLGPPAKRRGNKAYWVCPFHDDHDPSLVCDDLKRRWKCYPCGEGGDAAQFVMRKLGVTFPSAVAILAGKQPAIEVERVVPRSVEALRSSRVVPSKADPAAPKAMTEDEAEQMAYDADAMLRSPDGAPFREYLAKRGLTAKTILAAKLGCVSRARNVPWKPDGITIPWYEWGRLVKLNVRGTDAFLARFADARKPPPKYICAFQSPDLALYPSLDEVKPFIPAIIVEGELDALLLGQELAGLASVVTTGCASDAPGPVLTKQLAIASHLYVATDGDEAGEKLASKWKRRTRRIKPPVGHKDWGASFAAGIKLRAFWTEIFALDES
jgi:DNA primase